MNKLIGAVLLLLAYGFLIPGLTQPMLSLEGTVEKSDLVEVGRDIINTSENTPALMADIADIMLDHLRVEGSVHAFGKTQSILGTATDLFHSNHRVVAALIVLFSVIIPVFKGALIAATLFPLDNRWRQGLFTVSNVISKWSMADVFVVAIFVAFLATNGLDSNNNLVLFTATLGSGFWFFVSYCLLSIFATQMITWPQKRDLPIKR